MKKIILFLLINSLFSGCLMDNFYINEADQRAFSDMEESFQSARVYNDSLAYCGNMDSLCAPEYVQYCDSMFHHYANEWNRHHNNYSHDRLNSDHHHNGNIMPHQGHHNRNNDGHHNTHHGTMDQLMGDHGRYHP